MNGTDYKREQIPQAHIKKVKDTDTIRFVGVSRMWCRTIIKDGMQKQTWHITREDAEQDL